jgi:hypothetical protein
VQCSTAEEGSCGASGRRTRMRCERGNQHRASVCIYNGASCMPVAERYSSSNGIAEVHVISSSSSTLYCLSFPSGQSINEPRRALHYSSLLGGSVGFGTWMRLDGLVLYMLVPWFRKQACVHGGLQFVVRGGWSAALVAVRRRNEGNAKKLVSGGPAEPGGTGTWKEVILPLS